MSRLTVDKIHIKNLRAYYDDNTGTEVEETDAMLYYKTQTFYCKITIEIPTCTADKDWSIGLVQACDFMYLANDYGGLGNSLWEFHPLKSGLRKVINDSDGRQYPFYSVNQSLYNIKRGIVRRTTVNLQIKDYFHPSVVWELPYSRGVHLSEINRKQKFFIWLVAIKYGKKACGRDEIHILKKIRWEYNLHMEVDPHMPLGQKVRKIYDVQDGSIMMCDSSRSQKLPAAATYAPHCNAAQSLIWYPRDPLRHSRILVPPKQIIVPWETWVSDMLGPAARIRRPVDVIEISESVVYFKISVSNRKCGVFKHAEKYEMYLKNSKEISELAAEAYRYLRVRSEFWRQQEPMYNRVKKCKRRTSRNISSKDDLNALQRLVHMLQDISAVQHAGDHSKALQLCAALREDIKVLNPDFTALIEVMADLCAFEAVSNFHLQNYKEARDGFLAQLEICRNENLQHHIARCLENLGRAYAKLENYQAAKEVWTERLQYEMSSSDRSWLHFELGLCNMELGEYEEAVMNGLACKKGSEREFDINWELKACVLIAQAHLALNNLNEAQTYFQNAQYAAYVSNNQKLEELLASALEKVEAAIEENERKAVEEEYEGFGRSSISISPLNFPNKWEHVVFVNVLYPPTQARRPMLFTIGPPNRGLLCFMLDAEEEEEEEEEENWEDLSGASNKRRLGYGYHRGCFRAIVDQVPYVRRAPGPTYVAPY
ncbi:unnamed protein product [Taenia asiatica]|uniref:TPR_REGION domain-containing protein n=1 Tax=Taenia asiatica TaxID=60517 RepID=A0A0R3W208_TAEAS|nr:unnamed protein product [Taenia asiatica]